jgi:proteasome activator subunit 4
VKLKDTDIDAFVQCLLPLLKMAMFSKIGSVDAASTYHNLALIRPEMVLPDLLDR